mgnify:CR=1 FL=1
MVEYNAVNKELASYVWGESNQEDYSYKAVHNDSLIFNEDFEILPVGTKVLHNEKLGYIMGDDRDNCPDGYHDSLNYYIKYAVDRESYEDVQKRIDSENSPWYDFMDIWYSVKVVPSLNLENLKIELDKKEFFDSFLDKVCECHDIEVLKSWSIDRWNKEIMLTLCFSYSSLLPRLVEDNKDYFEEYARKSDKDLESYIDSLIISDGKVAPFTSNNPYEFFKLITEFSEKMSMDINSK